MQNDNELGKDFFGKIMYYQDEDHFMNKMFASKHFCSIDSCYDFVSDQDWKGKSLIVDVRRHS
jgi:hypothetical protein